MTVYEIYFNIASTENMICIYNNNFLQKSGHIIGKQHRVNADIRQKAKNKKIIIEKTEFIQGNKICCDFSITQLTIYFLANSLSSAFSQSTKYLQNLVLTYCIKNNIQFLTFSKVNFDRYLTNKYYLPQTTIIVK